MGMKPRLDFDLKNVPGVVNDAKKVGEFGNIPGTVSQLRVAKINPDSAIPGTTTPSPKK